MRAEKITVGYDASAALQKSGGIPRYTEELLRAMSELAGNRFHFVVLLNSLRHGESALEDLENVTLVRRRIPGPVLVRSWEQLGLPSFETVVGQPVDLIHAPAMYLPPDKKPLVTTVHDLFFLDEPTGSAPLAGDMFRRTFPRGLKQCAGIITPSRFVAETVHSHYGIRKGRIQPTPHGLSPTFYRQDHQPTFNLPPSMDHGYVLLISQHNVPRKRPEWAMALTKALAQENIPVVILGMEPWPYRHPNVYNVSAEQGRINDDQLACLYREARLTLLPTKAEGFGLPVIESLSQGAPVVCGRHSSLTEVGNTHVHFAKEESTESYLNAARELWHSKSTNDWQIKAREYAQSFTWKKAAEKTLAMYRRVVL